MIATLRSAAACATVWLACAAAPAPAFQVWRHVCMSEQMLALEKIGGPALELIKVGTYMPDVAECLGFCYCPEVVKLGGRCLWSPHEPDPRTILGQLSQRHFDNTRIEQARDHVTLLVASARTALLRLATLEDPFAEAANRSAFALALEDFGEALHALQDFYAHSTWAECHLHPSDEATPGGPLAGDSGAIGLWDGTPQPAELASCEVDVAGRRLAGLQTGYVDLPAPAGFTLHDHLNKDEPGSPEGGRRVDSEGPAATLFELVSGHRPGIQDRCSFGPAGMKDHYAPDGLAARHTRRAIGALLRGTAVFEAGPTAPGEGRRGISGGEQEIRALLERAARDPGLVGLAKRRARLLELDAWSDLFSEEIQAAIRELTSRESLQP